MICSGWYSSMSLTEPVTFCEDVQKPGLAACSHHSQPPPSQAESARTSRISSRTRKRLGTRFALSRFGLVLTRRLSLVITLKSLVLIHPPRVDCALKALYRGIGRMAIYI